MAVHTILKTSHSLFGKITIGETLDPHVRWMKINDEIEGQVFLNDDGSPSAIAASRYLYAFIIPAWHFPNSHGLMLGLGAGIGATMLLTLFPELSLTVIEIDPEVIRLAREYFPLVSFYEAQGRLHIIESSAENYVLQSQEKFSFTLLDVFSGDEGNQHNFALINNVLRISPYFMANTITSEKSRPEISKKWMWLRTIRVIASEESNWMLTNMTSMSPAIHDFQLFNDTNINAKAVNSIFKYILSQINAACFY